MREKEKRKERRKVQRGNPPSEVTGVGSALL